MKTINKNTCHYPAGLDNPEKGNSNFTRYSGQARVGQTKKAFTLVELIIVITILAILATIAFVSFKSYFGNARDSVRVSDIKTIHQGLSLYRVKIGELPKPDNGVEIKVGNTLLTYQGEIGTGILRQIQINGKAKDPIDGRNYVYSIDKLKTKMQLMGYLETGEDIQYISQNLPNIIKKIYANELNYLNRYVYVYGDKIGVITDDKKVPIQYTQEDTSSGFNILDQESSLITYFGGDVYEGGKSTSTGNVLAVQLDSGVNGTLPCSAQIYNGYNIIQLSHDEIKDFTKTINISNGTQVKQLTIQCIDGDLDKDNSEEIILETNCTTNGYVPYNNECVENKCKNNIPNNATSNGENNEPNKNYHLISWTHNIGGGDCTYVCNLNFTYNSINKTCDADTRLNQNCSSKPEYSIYNIVSNITQTWSGSTTRWEPTLDSVYNETSSNNECRFKCNTGYTYDNENKLCLGNSCNTPTIGIHEGITYSLASTGISHLNNVEIISANNTFGANPNNGTINAKFNFSCNAGELSLTSTQNNTSTCNTGYSFNNDWSNPACNVNIYTVSFNSNGGSDVSDINTNYNTTINQPTNPIRTGYTFAGWYKESGFTNIWNFGSDKVMDNTTLYAKWTDNIAPTITSVSSSSPSCNNIRFTINGASDNGTGLHSTPYSFDGGLNWQSSNYKDYPGTSYTINANLIKVKDNAPTPNIYNYASSINGTSSSCYTYSWQYGNYGNCSVSSPTLGDWSSCNKACGSGTQTRTCSTAYGTQTRTATCKRSDGITVSNSYCGTPITSQSCSVTCSGYSTSQSCNTQSCCTSRASVGSCSGGTCRFNTPSVSGTRAYYDSCGKLEGYESCTRNCSYGTIGGGSCTPFRCSINGEYGCGGIAGCPSTWSFWGTGGSGGCINGGSITKSDYLTGGGFTKFTCSGYY